MDHETDLTNYDKATSSDEMSYGYKVRIYIFKWFLGSC